MADTATELQQKPPEAPSHPAVDVTGRDRLARNVLASWAGHMVFVLAGFIMPRVIDRSIGQEALGVWDFGWSLVSYFGLANVGIGSSVNRYVAKHRATGDAEGLNRTIASVMVLQLMTGTFVIVLTLTIAWLLPSMFRDRLGDHVAEARWVVLLLGSALAVQMWFDAFNGVVTGCHRWDVHNGLNAGMYAVTVVAMVTGLLLGGGLKALALANFCGTLLTEMVRCIVAHRICPELRIRLTNARLSNAISTLVFGGKTMLNSLSRLLLYQTNSIIIVSYMGAAALALYSRPKALVSNAQTFVNKFAFILVPTASSLHAGGEKQQLRDLLVHSSRLGTYMALPMVLTLVIMGDPILKLWMGPRYQQGLVLAILAIGHLTEMTRQPILNIMAGMNMHGRLGVVNLVTALCSVALGLILVGGLGWGLLGAALAISLPLMLVNGTYVPVYACRRLEMPVSRYFTLTSRGPVLCALPFAACLLLGRFGFPQRPMLGLAVGCLSGGVVLAVLYWQYVLPERIRCSIRRRLPFIS